MSDVQDVLDRMEVLDNDLQLQSGEDDADRGLTAVNMAQDHFEAMVAQRPGLLGDDKNTVTTAASTETTTFPTGLLRLDSMWYIDAATSLPRWELEPLFGPGSHRARYVHPVRNLLSSSTNTGKPEAYWTNGSNIYWDPLPDGTHTVRWYGFAAAGDYTSPTDTFAYPNICMGPFAAFAARLMQLGFDDPDRQYNALARELFSDVIKTLSNFRREGPRPIKLAAYGWM